MSTTTLHRATFQVPRSQEYFHVEELERQTGQPRHRFATVVLKEAIDNALDACEKAKVPPKIEVIVSREGDVIRLMVTDNGEGIPEDVIRRICNLDTLTSDKIAYRSPTRGAQGNAFKTILGIPYALAQAGAEPVVVEACGIRHTLALSVSPSGEVQVRHDRKPCGLTTGTRISAAVLADGQDFDARSLVVGYALFNPHAEFSLREDKAGLTLAPTLRALAKFLPSDPTSAHWYEARHLERLIFAYITAARDGRPDLSLREFVRQFRGLSSPAKLKDISHALPEIRHLSDFEAHTDRIPALLAEMQSQSVSPKPSVLGRIGKARFEHRFRELYDDVIQGRSWYASREGVTSTQRLPFIVEVAVAEMTEHHGLWVGLNFSAAYEQDPFEGAAFKVQDRGDKSKEVYGLRGLLDHFRSKPGTLDFSGRQVVVAVHLTCPGLEFTDKGKTRLLLQPEIEQALLQAVSSACKEHDRWARRQERAAATPREDQPTHRTASVREATFDLIPVGIVSARGEGKYDFPQRNVWYAIRDAVRAQTGKELAYEYFTQLLTDYENAHGPIQGMYRKARGYLLEPFTGRVIPLGTREVETYEFPPLLYNKILFIEKEGFIAAYKAAKFPERYDVAVICGEGYAVRAHKELLAAAEQQEITVAILHDADGDGPMIAETLSRETRASRHRVTVIDLGLTLEQARSLGLPYDTYNRDKDLAGALVAKLSSDDLAWLRGREMRGKGVRRRRWEAAHRYELNVFNPIEELVKFTERRLLEEGLTAKVCPPADVVRSHIQKVAQDQMREAVFAEIDNLVGLGHLAAELAQDQCRAMDYAALQSGLQETLGQNPPESWREISVGSLPALDPNKTRGAVLGAIAKISPTGKP